jgi:hypothetical protein
VRQDGVLDLDRGDVLAAPDDDVLGAVLDQDVALLVDDGHVAGVEPAVADRRGRGLRVLVVAVHDGVRADDDLADLLAVGRTSRPSEWTTRSPTPTSGQPVQDLPGLALLGGSDSVRKVRGVARVRIGEVSVRARSRRWPGSRAPPPGRR